MIELEHVCKSYPGSDRLVVDDLSMKIVDGEICVLLGESGCGKTTTLRLINRLEEPDSGKILIDGEDISAKDPNDLRLGIGYVIQETGLFPHYSVERNIAVVLREKKQDKAHIEARVREMMALIGLDYDEYAHRRPSELSGGQRQRVGVARALAAEPSILLMDEPFGALDPVTRGYLQDEFLKIQGQLGKTVVFVTHDIGEALKMGDRIAILENGTCAQFDTPAEILSHPATPFVERLLGANRQMELLKLTACSDAAHLLPCVGIDRLEGWDGPFPFGVLDAEGRPIGYLEGRLAAGCDAPRADASRDDAVLRSEDALRADAALRKDFGLIDGKESLYAAANLLADGQTRALFVEREGRVVGLLTPESAIAGGRHED